MKKIIHVDNSEFFRKVMKNFLREHGCGVESVSNGGDAFREVSAGKVSLVIMGMELGDMTGEQFVKKIVGSSYSVPLIAVTSNDSAADKKRFMALGLKDYILKSETWQEKLLPYLKNN